MEQPAPGGVTVSIARARAVEWAVGVTVVLLLFGPFFFAPGLSIIGDMVFVPEQPWKNAWIGADGGVPRAVPGDAVVSVLSQVLGGKVVQAVALAGASLAGFLGMCRLTAGLGLPARLAAALCFTWNPYVHERLAIGHWALLCGYAALPWVAWAVLRLRSGAGPGVPDDGVRGSRRRAWAVLVVAFGIAGWMSPTGGVLTVLTALALVLPRWQVAGRVLLLGLWVNLPWIFPAFLNGADQLAPDAFGVTAFASRSDSPWGVFGSVFSFGGMWKESVLPLQRADLFFASAALLLAVLGAVGLLQRQREILPRTQSLLLAAGALLLACAGAWEFSRPAVEWAVEQLPGGGLLRDAQKWIAPWVLVASVGFGLTVQAVREWGLRRGSALVALPLVLLPPLALPSSALLLGGLVPVAEFPQEWHQVRAEMERLEVGDERVVVLPFSTYRQFDWTPRPVLDPAPRFFPGTMVVEDALTVPEGTVGGESALAAQVRAADSPESLRVVLSQAGVRWALVHAGRDEPLLPAGATTVLATEQIDLLRLDDAPGEKSEPSGGSGGVSSLWRLWLYAVVDAGVLVVSLILMISLARATKPSQVGGRSVYTRRSQT